MEQLIFNEETISYLVFNDHKINISSTCQRKTELEHYKITVKRR